MPNDQETTYKDYGLKNLIKALSGDIPKAKVGVLGDHNIRQDGESNATIGLKHEFGEGKLPQRSFLRQPLIEHLQAAMDESGVFDQNLVKRCIKESSLLEFVKKIGLIAENVVLVGFDTGGYGKWKASNMAHKVIKQTLVETTQLRDSITSDVK